jgi:hypothetical protein
MVKSECYSKFTGYEKEIFREGLNNEKEGYFRKSGSQEEKVKSR